jgi:hypothetical protein
MILIPLAIEKYPPAGSVPPLSHLTSCTPIKCNLYFDIFAPLTWVNLPCAGSYIPCPKSHVHFI